LRPEALIRVAAGHVVLTRCVSRRRHARAGLAPWRARLRRFARTTKQSPCLSKSLPRTNLRRRSGVSSRVPGELMSRCRTRRRRFHRTPLLRFLSLQRVPTAMRCPWEPTHRTIPLRRFRPVATRASAEVRNDDLSPSRSGVALAVFRSANVNAAVPGVGLVARLCVALSDDSNVWRLVFDRPCGRFPE